MDEKQGSTTLSIYIPKRKDQSRLTERLQRIAKERDRSINYIVVEAISEYLDRMETKNT